MTEYVERKALRDALYDADAITMDGVRIINQFHAADVAPVVHGRWIEKEEMIASYLEDCTEVFYECSVCKEPNEWESMYCPNCGAKMGGG